MPTPVYVLSECCPVGCSVEVIALRARDTGLNFAYCDGCGCTWSRPSEALFSSGLNEVVPISQRAPNGVTFPSHIDIGSSGFLAFVLRTVTDSEWGRTEQEISDLVEKDPQN
jgi:hypothetical protein